MRVRILRSLATRDRAFMPGSVVEVDDMTGRAWVQAGVAEEDKSLPGPLEVKENASKIDNTADSGASDSGRSKTTSKNRRKRRG